MPNIIKLVGAPDEEPQLKLGVIFRSKCDPIVALKTDNKNTIRQTDFKTDRLQV